MNYRAAQGTTCMLCPVSEALKTCRCSYVRYCGKDHQRADWKAHKLICPLLTQASSLSDSKATTVSLSSSTVNISERAAQKLSCDNAVEAKLALVLEHTPIEHQLVARRLVLFQRKCAWCYQHSQNIHLTDCQCGLVAYCSSACRVNHQQTEHTSSLCSELAKTLACDSQLFNILTKHGYAPAYVGEQREHTYKKLPKNWQTFMKRRQFPNFQTEFLHLVTETSSLPLTILSCLESPAYIRARNERDGKDFKTNKWSLGLQTELKIHYPNSGAGELQNRVKYEELAHMLPKLTNFHMSLTDSPWLKQFDQTDEPDQLSGQNNKMVGTQGTVHEEKVCEECETHCSRHVLLSSQSYVSYLHSLQTAAEDTTGSENHLHADLVVLTLGGQVLPGQALENWLSDLRPSLEAIAASKYVNFTLHSHFCL